MGPTPPLPPFDRSEARRRLASEAFDLVVVGGGATGCGIAVDAAARGLRTALVEARDFASGTSAQSSKLIHGGLRYLGQHDYHLVYEALAERQRLLNNAGYLVHPLPFLIPLFGRDGIVNKGVAKAYSAALWLYDLAGGVRIGHRHRRVDASEALRHLPSLRTDTLVAAFTYWDAQADDARLTMTLARTAAGLGAAVANYSPATSLIWGDDGRRVCGVRLADGIEVHAPAVVFAGGVWTERLQGLDHSADGLSIRPAKGIHLSVPAERLPCDQAAVLTVPGDRRTVFVVPWDAFLGGGAAGTPGRYTYIGTTDTDYDGPLEHPGCTAEDVDYLLGAVNAWTTAGLTPADVTATWAGLRPLIRDTSSPRTADLSRRHKVLTNPSGVVTVTGGKLTTYRRMAADTVDAVVALLGRGSRRCPTRHLRLVGASEPGGPLAQRRRGRAGSAALPGIDAATAAHLFGRYGSAAPAVVALAAGDEGLLAPLVEGLPYLGAEVVFAARHEMATSVEDVLARRTRALILDREKALAAGPAVAAILAGELGWDAARVTRELAELATAVDAERAALTSSSGAPDA